MPIYTECFVIQDVFRDVVEMPESSHCSPANTKRRVHIGCGPVQDLGEFGPVGDLVKRKRLDRGARDDESVEVLVPDFLPRAIEGDQVILRGVLGRMSANTHEGKFNLERRRSNETR